jgi:hypothetical protein
MEAVSCSRRDLAKCEAKFFLVKCPTVMVSISRPRKTADHLTLALHLRRCHVSDYLDCRCRCDPSRGWCSVQRPITLCVSGGTITLPPPGDCARVPQPGRFVSGPILVNTTDTKCQTSRVTDLHGERAITSGSGSPPQVEHYPVNETFLRSEDETGINVVT